MKLLYIVANQNIVPSVADFVSQVTRKTGASLLLLVAAETEKQLKDAEASFANLSKTFEGLSFSTKFALGDPVLSMKEELAKDDYTMILMGVRRRQRLIPSHFRVISQRIIKHSPIPIMLIRDIRGKLERMLVCTGGLNISQPVIELSTKLAGMAGLHATLLTVAAAVPSMYTGMMEMEETLEELLETDTPLAQHLRNSAEILTKSGIQAEIKVRHGDVVEAILEETAEGEYDLVVLGETHAQTLRGLLLGNITQQIINRAPSAVLISK
jgi:nucleotide-binding universal stress UspA family protein